MSNVKELTANELPRIQELGLEFAAEVGYPAFNFASFSRLWSGVLRQGLGKFYYVELDGKVVGVLGASFIDDPFSGQRHAHEQFWFVTHSQRHSRIGLELLNHFEKDAKAKGCKKIVMVHLAHSKEEVLPKLYARRGFTPVEVHYWKSLE